MNTITQHFEHIRQMDTHGKGIYLYLDDINDPQVVWELLRLSEQEKLSLWCRENHIVWLYRSARGESIVPELLDLDLDGVLEAMKTAPMRRDEKGVAMTLKYLSEHRPDKIQSQVDKMLGNAIYEAMVDASINQAAGKQSVLDVLCNYDLSKAWIESKSQRLAPIHYAIQDYVFDRAARQCPPHYFKHIVASLVKGGCSLEKRIEVKYATEQAGKKYTPLEMACALVDKQLSYADHLRWMTPLIELGAKWRNLPTESETFSKHPAVVSMMKRQALEEVAKHNQSSETHQSQPVRSHKM